MSQTVIVLDTDVDPLWLRHLPRSPNDKTGNQQAHSDRIISFRSLSTTSYPYFCDVPGWRRWFQRNDIQELHCYLPGGKSWAVLSAAVFCSIPISLYITRYLEPGELDYLKLWQKRTNRISCAGNLIRQQLQAHGLAADKIIVEPPEIPWPPSKEVDLESYKNRLELPDGVYTLLSLVPPQDPKALKEIVWTAAIVKHACPDIRLIVAGEFCREDRSRLIAWKKMFKIETMLLFYQKSDAWDILLRICNAVFTGKAPEKEVIRLLYARAAETPLITGGKKGKEFIDGYQNAIHVHPPTPRQFASVILDRMREFASTF